MSRNSKRGSWRLLGAGRLHMPGARRLVVNVSIAILLGPAVRVTAKRWYQITSAAGRRAPSSPGPWPPCRGRTRCRCGRSSGSSRARRPRRIVDNAIPSNACWVDPPSSPSEAMARDSTGGVLGMPVKVKDPIRLLRRIAVAVTGTVILAIGVVLLVAPGPGLVVIALALAVFAIEFQWARRNLAAVQARARSAALKAAASRVATASAVLFGVGAIGLGAVSVFTDLLPLSGAGTGVGVAVGGLTVLLTTAYGVRELRNAKKAQEDGDAE